MAVRMTRRSMVQGSVRASAALFAAGLLSPTRGAAASGATDPLRLHLNENAWGPSPSVLSAVQSSLPALARYGDPSAARALVEEIAACERVPPEQVVPGEILVELGLYLGSQGGPGGEFLYSTPGYLALVDAARQMGGVGVGVPLNAELANDLPALAERVTPRTRALYLINPHNPSGTVSDPSDFRSFLRTASRTATVIVDEAYLEYTQDFTARSAVSLVREGARVIVFRTFVKIHGLAGLPIGYALVPAEIGTALRARGLGDAEALGRLNMAAASAALRDLSHVSQVRSATAVERELWHRELDAMKLRHSDSHANFIFFDCGRSHDEVAAQFAARGILVGRGFPPYDTWLRITIGLPEENRRARRELRSILAG